MGQLGSFSHTVSHLNERDGDRPHEFCELCVAYASFDTGTTGSNAVLPGDAHIVIQSRTLPLLAGSAVLPPYSSRAPPLSSVFHR